tara:strand:+ start:834 stop:1199 length:366 start_codon:yes stop_codon:yes gene_type:complete
MKHKIYKHFKESIKNREDYLNRMEDYFTYRELYKQRELRLLMRSPFTSLFILILNLPTKILRHLNHLKDRRDYDRARVDIEIMNEYIKKYDKKIELQNEWIDKTILPMLNKNIKKNNEKHH